MMWLLIIVSVSGGLRREGPFEREKCETMARQMNSPSSYLYTPGVEAHCAPEPR